MNINSLDFIIMISLTGVTALIIGVGVGYLIFSTDQKQGKNKSNSHPAPANKKGESSSQRMRKMYQLITDLTTTLNYERVLEKSLDAILIALRLADHSTDRLISAVLLFSENDMVEPPELYVAYGRGLPRTDSQRKTPGMEGLLEAAIESGESQLTKEAPKDPELKNFLAFRACQSAFTIPLRAGLDTFGVLLFGHPEEDYFNTDCQEILSTVGHQAQIALQNAQLFQELKSEKDQIIKVQEEARRRLARALHDGPTQTVAAIPMQISRARHLLNRDVDAAAEALYQTEDLARRTSKQIRHMLFTLRPLILESEGLTAALESMAEKTRETFGQNVSIKTDPSLMEELNMNAKTVIFTITEEAVNNARKHANADHIQIRLQRLQEDLALLEIEDDGKGFDVEKVTDSYEDRDSLGMINMRERAELVEGVFHIKSQPGQGTTIQVVLPLTDDAADRLRLI
ncbi:MAG: GAF domain-containing sensor histidine kinase [Anaerolineales bacterium]|nr:GAF domain-containing sensor histidine kinase [Anaerolineales bacterium]